VVTDDIKRKSILDEARANIAFSRSIEQDHADELVQIPDRLTAWRANADARTAAREAETRRREREAGRDQREREIRRAMIEADIDGRIAAALERLDLNEKGRIVLRAAADLIEQAIKVERAKADRAIRQLRNEFITKQHDARNIIDIPSPLIRRVD
jgi:hypothetical protein